MRREARLRSKLLVSILAVGITCVAAPAAASAANVIPTDGADEFGTNPGHCSLREAITAAQGTGSFNGCTFGGDDNADTILLTSGTIYSLSIVGGNENLNATGDLDVLATPPTDESLTIQSTIPGSRATIDGNGATTGDRVLDLAPDGAVGTTVLSTVNLTDLNITDGVDSTSDLGGAGIYAREASGNVNITGSRIFGNTALGLGGAIRWSSLGTGAIADTTIESNFGGRGGGIAKEGGGLLTVRNSTVDQNTVTSGVGVGGGIDARASAVTTVENSTITNNSSNGEGGGISADDSPVNLSNVTLASNHATQGNGGGGLIVFGVGVVHARNSLISDNTDSSGSNAPDCATNTGSFVSDGYNLIEDTAGCSFTPDNDLTGLDPSLTGLSDNGGPTQTRAPLPGSPALDAANPANPDGNGMSCLATDQRGVPRGGAAGRCDIGAYEERPAATITVTTTADEFTDPGPGAGCSLREAVRASNTSAAFGGCPAGVPKKDDTIVLQSGQTYGLSIAGGNEDSNATGDLDIFDETVTIQASGPGRATIDATGTGDRVLEVDPPLSTSANASVTLTNLGITGGEVGPGAGVWSQNGSLTMTGSRVFGNDAVQDAGSGLRLELGGTITNSSIDSNTGGSAIFLEFGSLTITGSTISGNTETGDFDSGGGISKANNATLTLANSTVSGNSSKGDGGGIAQFGTGILNLRNATIAGNIADSDSGGPSAGNGGGLFVAAGTANVRNSIIAGNIDNSGAPPHNDCSGTIVSELHNVIGSASGCTGVHPQDDFQGAASVTAPLAANGGPTDTRALLAGSVALNPDATIFTGPGPGQPCEATDQRGQPRGGAAGTCDPGAFEAQPPALAPVGNKSVQAGQTLTFTVSAADPDPADTLTLSESNLPPGATFTPGTGVFSWTPTAADVGGHPNVGFSAFDGTFADNEAITITVTPVPPPSGGSPGAGTPTAPTTKKKCKKKKRSAAAAKKCKKKR
jgi:CSLREA domain-containing protein